MSTCPYLLRLHLVSRRIPTAMIALAACALLMQWAIRTTMSLTAPAGARTSAEQLALLLEAATAAVVSAAMHGPFGESERATVRYLPWLRLTTVALLIVASLAALTVGIAGAGLPVGEYALLRDTSGMIGIGLVGTVIVGGNFAWIGPAGYFVVAAYAVADKWRTPWTWPARPSDDLGGALCAYGLLAVAVAAMTVIGPRERSKD